MADDTEAAEVDGRGLNRRSLIRNAFIAGSAAWSAPVILGSIASPAAAVSANGCFQMWTILNPANGDWTPWFAGTVPFVGCNALDACIGTGVVQDATSDMLSETGPPSPTPPTALLGYSAIAVTVTAPPGCRIGGVGFYLSTSDAIGTADPPTFCLASSTSLAAPRVEITIPPLTRASVTIEPRGSNGGNSAFWDNGGLVRSSIFVRLLCP